MVTIKIIHVDKDKIIGRDIGDENKIIEIELNKNIYLGLLAEMKKANISVDEKLECFNNRIFTIVETAWRKLPKDLKVEPRAFCVALRKDIENIQK